MTRMQMPSGLRRDCRGFTIAGAALAVIASALAARAVQPQLTITQLGSSACKAGYFYPSVDNTAKKVAFTSFCDLVPGGNTDGNSELFLMSSNGTGLVQLTSSVGGLGVLNPKISSSGLQIVFASDRDLIPGGNADGNDEIFIINVDGTACSSSPTPRAGDLPMVSRATVSPASIPRGRRSRFRRTATCYPEAIPTATTTCSS